MNSRILRFISLFVVALPLLVGIYAYGQRLDGTLRGLVTDPSGAVMPGAKVTATNEATGVSNNTTTTSAGDYVFPSMLVGRYMVTVEAGGFQKFLNKGVQVFANQVTQADARLSVGSSSTTVEVTGGAALVQTTSSQLSNDFNTRQVADLPNVSLQGSPLNLAMFAPNTTTQGAGVLGEGGSIGGARPRLNSFNIDGVDDNRIDITGHTSEVIQESVAEFNLVTNQFSAESGHSAGGQFNIITKSGTNNWHGAAWGYNQNRDFNAMDNLEKGSGLTEPRRIDYNRVGADIGGPLIKNNLFVFGAYQRQWLGLSAAAVAQEAPTAQGLATLNTLADSAIQDILKQFPVAPANDAGTETVNGVAIPLGTIQPAAPSFLNQHDFNVNVDLNTSHHQFRWRFLYDRQRQPNVNPDTPLPQFTGNITADSRKILFTDAWTLTDRLVNNFGASYSRFVQGFTVPSQFSNFPNAEVDTMGLSIGPEGNSPQSYTQNNYQIFNNITYARGRHTFKGGAEWRHWIAPSSFLPRERGEWDWANLDEFIKDLVPTGFNGALRGAGSGNFAGNQNAIYGFVQDDVKVASRLTLNLGLRYEWIGQPRDTGLQALNAISNLPGVEVLPGVQYIFRKPKSDTNNVAPRFGFAWDPTGKGTWAIRGGFGVSYDLTPQNFPLLSLPPQLQTEQNPDITCSGAAGPPPAWCPSFLAGTGGAGFLAGGGLAQVNVPPTTQADARAATQGIIIDATEPKVLTWTLGVQRQLGSNSSVEARYLGTRSLELPVQARTNTHSGFDAGLTPLPSFFSPSDIPAAMSGAPSLLPWDNFDPFRFDSFGFQGLVTAFPPVGAGTYHGGSVDFNHRLRHGLTLRANYSFSHNIDNATNELFSSRVNPRRPYDWQNMRLDLGNSVLDVRHKFALTWIYDLPTMHGGNGFTRVLVNGWLWSGTFLAQSGQPVTLLGAGDNNDNADSAGDRAILNPHGVGNTGTTVSFVCNAGPGGATSIVSDPATCGAGDDANIVGYVADDPTARYVQAGLGSPSTVGRNSFRSPGVNLWNMGAVKNIKITERLNVQFRAEALDVFNHRNFSLAQPSVFESGIGTGNTVNNALSTTYSNVTSGLFLNAKQFTGGSRTMQLGLKITF